MGIWGLPPGISKVIQGSHQVRVFREDQRILCAIREKHAKKINFRENLGQVSKIA